MVCCDLSIASFTIGSLLSASRVGERCTAVREVKCGLSPRRFIMLSSVYISFTSYPCTANIESRASQHKRKVTHHAVLANNVRLRLLAFFLVA